MAVMPQKEPIRLYAEDDARLPRRLATSLTDRIATLSETVLNGQLDEKQYRQFTGELNGLKFALSECERIDTELSGN